jgi:predicted RNA-binding Zn ribbon-like protein
LSFRFLSGRVCLAFCATVGERWRYQYERLRTPNDLRRWFVEARLLDEPPPPVSEADLRRARKLREAIYRAAQAVIAGRSPAEADEQLINAAAAVSPVVLRIRRGEVTRAAADASAALSSVARDAIDLFVAQPERIRECASPECGLLFFDSSRPGRRRWCSSAACGGRDRAARFRRRHSRERPGSNGASR